MNKFKERIKNDDGFTLVEMIIVLAIIVVMTTASFITLSVINTAKAKDAAVSFENALADVSGSGKSRGVDYNLDGVVDGNEKNYVIALKLYKSGKKVYVQKIAYDLANDVELNNANYTNYINKDNSKGISLSSNVDVEYYKIDGNKAPELSESNSYILVFNKKGECRFGFGTYKFTRKNGKPVVSVQVNKSGGYISK